MEGLPLFQERVLSDCLRCFCMIGYLCAGGQATDYLGFPAGGGMGHDRWQGGMVRWALVARVAVRHGHPSV